MEQPAEINQQQNSNINNQLITPLGQMIKHFPVSKRNLKRWLSIGIGTGLIFLAAIAIFSGILTTWTAVESHGRAVVLRTLPLPLVIFFISLPTGILLLIFAKLHWQDGITLYEKGIVVRKGKRNQCWMWDTVERFDTRIEHVKFATSIIRIRSQLILENGQGQRLRISDRYDEIGDMITRFRQNLLPRLFSKTLHLINQGRSVIFHPDLSVIKNGFTIKKNTYPWDSLEKPNINNGTLRINKLPDQTLLYKSNIKKIRNLDTLLALLENPPTS